MKPTISAFDFDGLQLRAVVNDGIPWFVAMDWRLANCAALPSPQEKEAA